MENGQIKETFATSRPRMAERPPRCCECQLLSPEKCTSVRWLQVHKIRCDALHCLVKTDRMALWFSVCLVLMHSVSFIFFLSFFHHHGIPAKAQGTSWAEPLEVRSKRCPCLWAAPSFLLLPFLKAKISSAKLEEIESKPEVSSIFYQPTSGLDMKSKTKSWAVFLGYPTDTLQRFSAFDDLQNNLDGAVKQHEKGRTAKNPSAWLPLVEPHHAYIYYVTVYVHTIYIYISIWVN